jgi:hypothetical protein
VLARSPKRDSLKRLGAYLAVLMSTLLAPLWNAVGTTAAASPQILLSPTSGPPGTHVTITGSGFPSGEIVALYIDLPGPYLGQPGPKADAQGAFHITTTWPDNKFDSSGRVKPTEGGSHNVCGDTSAGLSQPIAAKACAQFVVEAGPSPSASSVPSPPAPGLVGPSPPAVAVVIAIMIALGVITFVLLRRAQ